MLSVCEQFDETRKKRFKRDRVPHAALSRGDYNAGRAGRSKGKLREGAVAASPPCPVGRVQPFCSPLLLSALVSKQSSYEERKAVKMCLVGEFCFFLVSVLLTSLLPHLSAFSDSLCTFTHVHLLVPSLLRILHSSAQCHTNTILARRCSPVPWIPNSGRICLIMKIWSY